MAFFRKTLHILMLAFAAGAVGGLLNAVTVWGAGESGFNAIFGIDLKPALTKDMIYMRMVWGGIWGGLFILPTLIRGWPVNNVFLNGFFLSLFPSANTLFFLTPETPAGFMGLDKGMAMPFLVILFNTVWGIAGLLLFRTARH